MSKMSTVILSTDAITHVKNSNTDTVPAQPANNTSPSPAVVKENWNTFTEGDELQAVKQDPAVLKVQVTFESRREPPKKHSQFRETKKLNERASTSRFEELLSMQEAALFSLTPDQFHLLMKYVETLRRQRKFNQINLECGFCKNNGEPVQWYTSHALRSWRGRVLCPVLRALRCPRCGATGDRAHTIKYCPENLDYDFWSLSSSSSGCSFSK